MTGVITFKCPDCGKQARRIATSIRKDWDLEVEHGSPIHQSLDAEGWEDGDGANE